MLETINNKIKCIGIMNGTSLDGVDFVLIEIDNTDLSCRFISIKSFNFSKPLKQKLLLAVQHKLFVNELALLHHELGRYYSDCYKKLPIEYKTAQLIGLHGQTVFHKGGVATLQIGESSYLSVESNKPVISDFRVGDIALGGQGAPIATVFHKMIFAKKNKVVSVHNLGGISNLTILENSKLTQGFDTGPANMLIDMAIKIYTREKKQFDKDGKVASEGKVEKKLVKKMMQHSFLKKKPPKSCGREEFGEIFYKKYKKELEKLTLSDRLATLTEFVAESIVLAYQKFVKNKPSEIIFCGGGAKNKYLLQRVQSLMPSTKVTTTSNYGWPEQSIEGAAFAFLAFAKGLALNSNVCEGTGAKRQTSLGKITKV